ncbi:TPA: phosphoribosylanthranilate isomerase [Pseudomonas putida]|uniref:phosphoribosylanthranilate isomerase n=1 Tax=Pseudomonas TaxID=286 RepID=UPI00110CC30B|nr:MULTISPECIES: phosphoribosylanthranilate isomerase [Pseudomonas]MDD1995073.1 phosphoribosylanthranilate isomerase [Pseudomonas putida]HDS0919410.1 phosphoribosylanthranilate isomerase [Pseudomonas putida]HDS0933798.1 phosphoribosylanthranilate isomerase [Pseudomonas putida]HDS1783910.1 phosphoribosylanthranilate isomerase [Pseudomonas putida]HDS3799712.1 phosphoribosylanthranilate isomerase [Pseudomonas putida]
MTAVWPQGTIKVCGITRHEDVEACLQADVDLIGLVLVAGSKRYLTVEQAIALRRQVGARARVVGVFMDQPFEHVRQACAALAPDLVQLHGSEQGACWANLGLPLIRRVQPAAYRPGLCSTELPLLDPGAGDGVAHRWPPGDYRAAMIAGGLQVGNVAAMVRALSPAGVDVSSGVETSAGCKSAQAIETFCTNARLAFSHNARNAQQASLMDARLGAAAMQSGLWPN